MLTLEPLLGKQKNLKEQSRVLSQLIIFGWIYVGSTVSAALNSTSDSPEAQRYANVKLATVLLLVDFTMFFPSLG